MRSWEEQFVHCFLKYIRMCDSNNASVGTKWKGETFRTAVWWVAVYGEGWWCTVFVIQEPLLKGLHKGCPSEGTAYTVAFYFPFMRVERQGRLTGCRCNGNVWHDWQHFPSALQSKSLIWSWTLVRSLSGKWQDMWHGSVSEGGDPTPILHFRKQFLVAYITFQIRTGKENPW